MANMIAVLKLFLVAAAACVTAQSLVARAGPYDTPCQLKSGQDGVCIPTSNCSSGGGSSSAGFCPGAADIQCCTYGKCTANGVNGLCQPSITCTGTSSAGLCPGPAGIQCCTGAKSCPPPQVNQATLNLIESFEGWSPNPYLDPDGNPTIGWGHLCSTPNCTEIPYHIPLCQSDGVKLLQSDLAVAAQCVTIDISYAVVLNPNQYGALVSWAFNDGCGNVQSSTLVRELNEGQDPDTVVAEELPKWVYGGNGEVLPGLVRRRNAEVQLFQTAADGIAHPPPC